ncbi:CpsD/CapB family tyrosine-protein kinase [Ornithinibacillus sp. BX22]|uniref:non-specific protein-tyrosine kinase n=2 Tax=Ornithinibacillus TaxID=484508 RepID=A0A923L7K8_9BACI|nr:MULTISPECIES: CpsD/CapB family tyrosine-protein kinase [Ornithinibacillus]MBC5637995.1 CpsD/CapB family tyrosine-protein kinase [Ornithinibacillus hominis]MBS3681883.1 CpsD/CapB family tyrosine-protein kinase [Ornithinibacillus massiliensis]
MRKRDKGMRGTLVTMERVENQISEEFRSLRSNIKFASFNKNIKTIVITSPSSGDGKTMTAANLAMVFSQEGKKVLLVDADLRKPSIHYMYGLVNDCGLCNFLIGQKDINAIIRSVYPNIDVITSGLTPPNPPELLGSVQMSDFISEVREQYDVVVFDTPPVLAVTDATLIANQSDGCLLVVRVKKNDVKDVIKVKEQLHFAGANLLGAVINGKKQVKNEYYYKK